MKLVLSSFLAILLTTPLWCEEQVKIVVDPELRVELLLAERKATNLYEQIKPHLELLKQLNQNTTNIAEKIREKYGAKADSWDFDQELNLVRKPVPVHQEEE